MDRARQYCTFYVEKLFFGIEVVRVQEVIRHQQMTRVPLAPSLVRGLINLRGQIVAAIDLRRRLGLPDRSEEQYPMNVVVRTDQRVVSLLVDEIGDVLDVDEAAFERTPLTMKGVARDLIDGVYKLEDRLLLILDTDEVLRLEVAGGRDQRRGD
jgi:purine-binding chemotaxis protein CheW